MPTVEEERTLYALLDAGRRERLATDLLGGFRRPWGGMEGPEIVNQIILEVLVPEAPGDEERQDAALRALAASQRRPGVVKRG